LIVRSSRDAWPHGIDRLGFPCVLTADLNSRDNTGFVPVNYKGQTTGFELYHQPAPEILASYPHIEPVVGERDLCVTFCWGGDLLECAAALSSAAALAEITDGLWYDPQDGAFLEADEAVAATRKELDSITGN
jgi:hypothetical protein